MQQEAVIRRNNFLAPPLSGHEFRPGITSNFNKKETPQSLKDSRLHQVARDGKSIHNLLPKGMPHSDKAVLLPSIALLLSNCGVSPEYVNAVQIGEGAFHRVFLYSPPGEEAMVVKIPKTDSIVAINSGQSDEAEQIALMGEFFPQYVLPTEIRKDETTGKYIILQKAVKGRPITNHNYNDALKAQLEEIMSCNHNLMEAKNLSLDFVGIPGLTTWVKKQFKKILLRQSEFEISNLIIDEETGKVYVIDYDLLRLKDKSTKKSILSQIGFFVNRLLIKHYFGVDIKAPGK